MRMVLEYYSNHFYVENLNMKSNEKNRNKCLPYMSLLTEDEVTWTRVLSSSL